MPLLPYCILLDETHENLPANGILNSKLERLREFGLTVVCSEMEINSISGTNLQQAALEFHNVIHAVFAQKAVVPFRFPTWLNAQELTKHLRDESSRYKDFLARHASHVQMEVRIINSAPTGSKATSGAEHLRSRAAQLRTVREQAEEVKRLLSSNVIEWREREVPDGVRLFALIERRFIEEFREKLNASSVRTSGPWPATEFLESDAKN